MNRTELHVEAVRKSQEAKRNFLETKEQRDRSNEAKRDAIKASWQRIREEEAITSLIDFCESVVEFNTDQAIDRNNELSSETRLSNLDFASGANHILKMIQNYIDQSK